MVPGLGISLSVVSENENNNYCYPSIHIYNNITVKNGVHQYSVLGVKTCYSLKGVLRHPLSATQTPFECKETLQNVYGNISKEAWYSWHI